MSQEEIKNLKNIQSYKKEDVTFLRVAKAHPKRIAYYLNNVRTVLEREKKLVFSNLANG